MINKQAFSYRWFSSGSSGIV